MTPVEELHEAANCLDRLLTNVEQEMETSEYWTCYDPATAWRDGMSNGMGGTSGELSGVLGPQMVRPLIRQLREAREVSVQYPEMAADHDRAACDDLACQLVGEAVNMARAVLAAQPDADKAFAEMVRPGQEMDPAADKAPRRGLSLSQEAARQRTAELEEVRDMLEAAGYPGAHADDWPSVVPGVDALIRDLKEAQAQVEVQANRKIDIAGRWVNAEADARVADNRIRRLYEQVIRLEGELNQFKIVQGVRRRALSDEERRQLWARTLAEVAGSRAFHDHRPEESAWEHKRNEWLRQADAVLRLAEGEMSNLRSQVYEYESSINWNSTCTSCSRVLDSAIRETERATKLSEALDAVLEGRAGTAEAAVRSAMPDMTQEQSDGLARILSAIRGGND